MPLFPPSPVQVLKMYGAVVQCNPPTPPYAAASQGLMWLSLGVLGIVHPRLWSKVLASVDPLRSRF